jgi:HEAT repeat protein
MTSLVERTAGLSRLDHLDQEIAGALDLTYDLDPKVRAAAVRALCPCQLKADHPRVWDRLLEMARDESVVVRRNVFHVLADGSPRHREAQVVAVVEGMHDDPDPKLRRHVRRLLAHYRHGGRLNIL